MFDRLFGKKKPISTPPASHSKEQHNVVVKGMPISIVADRLRFPVELVGQDGSVILDDGNAVTAFITYVLAAKHAGWLGGNELIEVLRGNLINRKLETGMTISKGDAAEFVQTVISMTSDDPYKTMVVGDVLRLFDRGGVMVKAT